MTLLVKATVVIALALLAVKLARRSSAAVRHLMLSGAFAVLLLLPLASMVVPPVQFDVPVAPLASTVIWSDSADEAVVVAPSPAVSRAAGVQTAPGVDPATRGPATARLLSLVWAAGTLAFLAPVIVGLYRVSRLRRGGQTWPEGRRVVAALAHEAGGRRAVDVRLHDAVPGPVTCGLVRPVILLPADACTWSEGDLHRAVLHELEHVARADWAGQCAARIACAIYWFHPLVWMAWRELAIEAERACDDAVLRRAEPDDYASQLVGLARRLEAASHPPLPAMARSRDLPTRVRAVLDHAQARGRAGTARLAVAAAVVMLTVAAIAPLRAVARPQATALVADQALTYEVVSIRRSPSNALGSNGSNERPDGGLTLLNVPIRTLISRGYPDLAPIDMVGLPNWAISERFDVRATSPLSTATPEQRAAMMRAMLADRVGLVAHIETREQQVYDMVLARADRQLGPAIRPSEVDCVARDAADRAAREAALAAGDPPPPPVPPPFRPGELAPPCSRTRLGTGWEGDFTMAMLSQLLRGDTGRTVIDRTGLAGSYRLSLTFERSVAGRGPDVTPGPDGLPSLFSAIQDQLGLKLEPATAPRETLVIDRLERPTEN